VSERAAMAMGDDEESGVGEDRGAYFGGKMPCDGAEEQDTNPGEGELADC
jgi:hypothetical protein